MKKATLLAVFTVVVFTARTQNHNATKVEAEYYSKAEMLYSAMPAKYWLGEMDDFGARPGMTNEGDKMEDCKTPDCYMLVAGVGYGPPMKDAGYVSIRKEQQAIQGNDDASTMKKEALSYKEFNQYHLTVKLMANFISGEDFYYCQPAGYQKLTPPPGWDGWYLGSTGTCQGRDADVSFIFMGAAPAFKETKTGSSTKGTPTFPVNPSDVSQFKVKNIVMYIQGSKESVADFVKNVNTAALRGMIQN